MDAAFVAVADEADPPALDMFIVDVEGDEIEADCGETGVDSVSLG